MNTYTSRKQNLMIRRVLKIYLIKTQNMFKFDLKHGYYHMNKLVPRIFVENWKSWIFCTYSFCQSDLIKPRFLFGKIIHPLVNYRCKKLLKIACFLDECLSLLELLFEAIPSSNFVQETLQNPDLL